MLSWTDPVLTGVGKRHTHLATPTAQGKPLRRSETAGATTLVHKRGGSHGTVVATSAQVRSDDADLCSGAPARCGGVMHGGRRALSGGGIVAASAHEQGDEQQDGTR
jgi:hypothetical protein